MIDLCERTLAFDLWHKKSHVTKRCEGTFDWKITVHLRAKVDLFRSHAVNTREWAKKKRYSSEMKLRKNSQADETCKLLKHEFALMVNIFSFFSVVLSNAIYFPCESTVDWIKMLTIDSISSYFTLDLTFHFTKFIWIGTFFSVKSSSG